jgi:hypothetical protein
MLFGSNKSVKPPLKGWPTQHALEIEKSQVGDPRVHGDARVFRQLTRRGENLLIAQRPNPHAA